MASTWQTTSQRQTTMSDGNTFVPAVVVGFVTGLGNYGNVTIAATDYPAKVSGLIQAAANAMDAVSGLSSGGTAAGATPFTSS